MHKPLTAIVMTGMVHVATEGEISSAYTDLVIERDCTIYAASRNEGWAEMVCSGYRGYPVLVSHGDLRDSVSFGFPPASHQLFESFAAFNSVVPKVEWRIETDANRGIPF